MISRAQAPNYGEQGSNEVTNVNYLLSEIS